MCHKIRCDGKSWKFFGFQVELNKTLVYSPLHVSTARLAAPATKFVVPRCLRVVSCPSRAAPLALGLATCSLLPGRPTASYPASDHRLAALVRPSSNSNGRALPPPPPPPPPGLPPNPSPAPALAAGLLRSARPPLPLPPPPPPGRRARPRRRRRPARPRRGVPLHRRGRRRLRGGSRRDGRRRRDQGGRRGLALRHHQLHGDRAQGAFSAAAASRAVPCLGSSCNWLGGFMPRLRESLRLLPRAVCGRVSSILFFVFEFSFWDFG